MARSLLRLAGRATCLALAIALSAQEPTAPADQDLGRTRQRLQELRTQLGQLDGQVNLLRKRRNGVLVELQGITLRASAARATAEVARLNLGEIQREVTGLTRRKREIQRELEALRTSLRRHVRWLVALGPLGTLSFFPTTADIQGYLAKSRYLEWWSSNETRRLQRVQALHAELAEREREIVDAETRFSKAEAEASALSDELDASERRLNEHLSGIWRDEQRKKQLQEELKEESVMLERMLASLLSGARPESPFRTSVPFRSLMGSLRGPVEGTLAESFGVQTHPRFGTKTMNTVLLVSAESGAPVRAVAAGVVVMADSYQSYGLMAIVDHGGSYFSIYTHMRALGVQKGQEVRSGDTLGYVGDTPEGPRLGFEIRHQTTPEDPQRWLAARYRGRD